MLFTSLGGVFYLFLYFFFHPALSFCHPHRTRSQIHVGGGVYVCVCALDRPSKIELCIEFNPTLSLTPLYIDSAFPSPIAAPIDIVIFISIGLWCKHELTIHFRT